LVVVVAGVVLKALPFGAKETPQEVGFGDVVVWAKNRLSFFSNPSRVDALSGI
jgi:hypothetical protein